MNDKDLIALHRFRSALDKPDPDALARARSRVSGALGVAAVRHRPRWRLVAVPVAAAALVGATVLVVTSALPPAARTGPEPLASATSPSPSPSPSPPSTRPVIEQLALLAERAPVPPQPRSDQLIVHRETQYDEVGAHKSDRWLDPNGAIILRWRGVEEVGHVDESDPREMQRFVAQARAEMAKVGPGLFYPTWTELSTHTTDPAALLRELTTGQPHNAGDVVQIIGGISPHIDALAPPRLKAGLLRVLNLLDGVSAELVTAPDGSQVWAIGAAQGPAMRREVLVDAATGLVVGDRDVHLIDYVYPSGGPCFTCTPRPKASLVPIPPKVSVTHMWRVSLVAA